MADTADLKSAGLNRPCGFESRRRYLSAESLLDSTRTLWSHRRTMNSLWDRYQQYFLRDTASGLSLDISRMRFGDDFFAKMEPQAQRAFAAMADLEKGGIANPDEGRMVGHYWLRASGLAPTAELTAEIEDCNAAIKEFAAKVHASGRYTDVLLIGIGGSALGPQFLSDALGTADDRMALHFFDNTDPQGMDRVLNALAPRLEHTLVVVVSKSGGTAETRNGMLEAQAAYEKAGLDFGKHAVAVTGAGRRTWWCCPIKTGWCFFRNTSSSS